jgi:hypothetical protein
MQTRREILVGGALTIFWATATSAQDAALGCTLRGDDAEDVFSRSSEVRTYFMGNEPMIARSGDPQFDRALARTLSYITDCFSCQPGFAYFDDREGLNAYATPTVRSNGPDGTVLFGTGMLGTLLSRTEHPDMAVACVCAHEFGHILQYKHGLDAVVGRGQPTVKRIELQADYFAGYFAGVRKRVRPSYPAAVFATTAHSVGDTQFGNRNHHGTPDERAAAIVEGYYAGYRDQRSLSEAMQLSTNYVLTQ